MLQDESRELSASCRPHLTPSTPHAIHARTAARVTKRHHSARRSLHVIGCTLCAAAVAGACTRARAAGLMLHIRTRASCPVGIADGLRRSDEIGQRSDGVHQDVGATIRRVLSDVPHRVAAGLSGPCSVAGYRIQGDCCGCACDSMPFCPLIGVAVARTNTRRPHRRAEAAVSVRASVPRLHMPGVAQHFGAAGAVRTCLLRRQARRLRSWSAH